MDQDLAEAARRLYRLPLGQFTVTRNDEARRLRGEGRRDLGEQVRRLPKASTAAWVVNLLARDRTDQVHDLLSLGEGLRRAQAGLDRDRLRELNEQRQGLVAALARQARGLAEAEGVPVSPAVLGQVEQTLHAAMADATAAAAVRSGLLTGALTSTGLAPVDLTGQVALPGLLSVEPVSQPSSPRPAEAASAAAVQRAQASQAEAEQAARAAEQARDAADAAVVAAQQLRDGLETRLAELSQQVRDVERALSGAQREVDAAERERDDARGAYDRARRRAEGARRTVEQLAGGTG